ncbi:hypothetical protein [Tenacibaculum sp. UWU-22]|uniref:hypothetical protein n=1 Tax=Tenacibaculum sp. UWU-22 TaxID=3234187 RepID=UPI0034DB5C14
MKANKQIGGIIINSASIEILRKIPFTERILEPVANIIEGDGYNQYWVNIFTNIPTPNSLIKIQPDSSILLPYRPPEPENDIASEEKTKKKEIEIVDSVYLKYNGLIGIPTWINSNRGNQRVYCRDFEVLFKAENNIEDFNLVRISFDYSLKNPDYNVEAEAILVRNENIDPRTSRGTVTTVRKEK